MEKNPLTQGQKAASGILTRRARRGLLGAALFMVSALAIAQVFEQRAFQSPEQERRYQQIISVLRCLVCQNQNLADSNAPLAADLRNIVFDMVKNGKDDDEIYTFMVDRYGDFVLYKPPFRAKTVALWAGPFLLLVIGFWFLLRQVRKRSAESAGAAQLEDTERETLNAMLGVDPENRHDD